MEQKWWSRGYGDAAERRSSYAEASSFALCATEDKTEDRHDRGDQATGGGEEGEGGKEESRGAGVCSAVQIETQPADQQEPARKEWEKVLRPFKRREPWLCRAVAVPSARMSVV